jgi:mannose-6-phosphate isomerase-like protein (cupin superfamily)
MAINLVNPKEPTGQNRSSASASAPASDAPAIKIIRWRGGQHPTYQAISQKMTQEGLRPYAWSNGPNFRQAARSHGYHKVLYCVEGTLEVVLPDMKQSVLLRPGDRVELPRGVRHEAITGPRGAQCLESVK